MTPYQKALQDRVQRLETRAEDFHRELSLALDRIAELELVNRAALDAQHRKAAKRRWAS